MEKMSRPLIVSVSKIDSPSVRYRGVVGICYGGDFYCSKGRVNFECTHRLNQYMLVINTSGGSFDGRVK